MLRDRGCETTTVLSGEEIRAMADLGGRLDDFSATILLCSAPEPVFELRFGLWLEAKLFVEMLGHTYASVEDGVKVLAARLSRELAVLRRVSGAPAGPARFMPANYYGRTWMKRVEDGKFRCEGCNLVLDEPGESHDLFVAYRGWIERVYPPTHEDTWQRFCELLSGDHIRVDRGTFPL